MKIHQYLLAFVVFSFVLVGSLFVFNDMVSVYDKDINIDDDFNGTYNQLNKTYDLSQSVKDDVTAQEIEGGDAAWESMTTGSYTGVKRTILDSFSLVGAVLNDISRSIGVPGFVVAFALTAITIVATFSLIYLIFRFKG